MEATTKRVHEDPVLRQRYSFERSTDSDGDEVLHVDIWVDPGGGVTPHIHPRMEEHFHVLEGRASFLAGRTWTEAGAGESALVPPGTRHAYRNRGDRPAHIRCDARPPTSLQAFLEDAAALSRAGAITRQAIPKGPGAMLKAVAMAHHYSEDTVLLFPPLPPPSIQRLVVPPLARLAGRRGYRPGTYADAA
ncbi:MAG: cupin domain-containing protein [Thermoleophilaceae bacterium]|jgi:quercetin dioxygenase-like cupin family protein|nr:cupin domain-containing protein [Thermoleophilaceae bacterium]